MNKTDAICATVVAFEGTIFPAAARLAGLRDFDARQALESILKETGELPHGPTIGDIAEALLRRHMTSFLADRRRFAEKRAAA